ncbi:RasGTPase-activating protein [Tieghemostelium lacteum]|uniref:RasGTPase-activating protein n=1 Tax=Tieghemostelium lacteum TaxID=361077 RepID=A0A152A7V2_TIELA|nr:RasGTPase-activating protein [Tieghemostelium lacteum]|eukprot:KYR02117.1 RasGTPase-activating protein [Tieghemostelium lacteum]
MTNIDQEPVSILVSPKDTESVSSIIQGSLLLPLKEDNGVSSTVEITTEIKKENSNSIHGDGLNIVTTTTTTTKEGGSNSGKETSTIVTSTSITTDLSVSSESTITRDEEGKAIIANKLPISPTYESLLRSKKTKDCNLTVKVFEARSLIEARLRKKESTKQNKSFKRAQNLLTEISSPNLMTFSDTTDPYCVVQLDKQKHRTRTIPKKLNPFWCEEFQLEISDPNSSKLIINVMDEKKYSSDEHIGKLVIPINTLKDQKERELWYPLSSPASKKNVPQIQVKFNFKPISLTDPSIPGYIQWTVSFGRNLSGGVQSDDPTLSTPYINWLVRSKRGEVIIDEEGISWQDALTNGVSREIRESIECIIFTVWRYEPITNKEGDNASNSTPPTPNNSGYSTISSATSPLKYRSNSSSDILKSPDTKIRSSSITNTVSNGNSGSTPTTSPSKHHSLTPPGVNTLNGSSSTSSATQPLLSTTTTTTDGNVSVQSGLGNSSSTIPAGMEPYVIGQGTILGSHIDVEKPCELWVCLYPKQTSDSKFGDVRLKLKYSEEVVLPLESYLNFLNHLQDDNLYSIHLLGHVTKQREAVSHNLIRVFEKTGKCVFLLKSLTDHEIESTDNPDIIFRGNSLATKSVDLYMKLIGLPYLTATIGPHIKKIYSSKKSCEIDPTKIEKGEDIKKNGKNLLAWVKKITHSILSSVNHCPGPLREVFRSIQTKVHERYPKDEITKYTAVSGFIFLRFFCPAILAPKLFELMPDHPGIKTTRSLILIAKTLQNLANLVELGEHKEDFMKDMNRFVLDNMENMKTFINQLSIVPDNCPAGELSNPIVLEKELACLYRHLIKQKHEMLEEISQVKESEKKDILEAYYKLLNILEILEQEVIFTSSLN